jgi:hexosaminidase
MILISFKKFALYIVAMFFCKVGYGQEISIIPKPRSLVFSNTSEVFNVIPSTKFVIQDVLFDAISKKIVGVGIAATKLSSYEKTQVENGNIVIRINELLSNKSPESYKISVTSKNIIVESISKQGLIYGTESLKQILNFSHKDDKTLQPIPALTIEDEPRFQWRSFMLDVSEHFWSVPEVKKIMDSMAQYKLNTFHLHLSAN